MTQATCEHTWTVRPGTLIDVNPLARMIRAVARPVDLDGDGVPDGPADEDAASSAARLLLLHVVLESGRLTVAEEDGEIVAAAIWVPGMFPVQPQQVRTLLTRELRMDDGASVVDAVGPDARVRPVLEVAMTEFLDDVARQQPDLVLYAVVVAEHARAAARELARDVVAPVLSETQNVLALALDGSRADVLEASGFRERGRIPLGASNAMWVGAPA